MYQALSPKVVDEMWERGNVLITAKSGWEDTATWSATPSFLTYCIGESSREKIFSCYVTRDGADLSITNVEATNLISDKKCLVDAYLHVALRGLINFAKFGGYERLIVNSYISSSAEHMADLGFRTHPRSAHCSVTGTKKLKET